MMTTSSVKTALLTSIPYDTCWQAKLFLHFAMRHNKTVLTDRYQYGPLTVQRPFYPEGDCCHIYLLHPPGGIVGGDNIQIKLNLAKKSHVLVTMPGATKFYKTAGDWARLHHELTLDSDTILEWLPPDNIIFNAARAYLCGHYRLAKRAKLFGWESLQLGRDLANAPFIQGELDNQLNIQISQHEGLYERLRLSGGQQTLLNHFTISATCFAYPATIDMLIVVRQVLIDFPSPGGATLLDGMLVIRLLSSDNQQVQSMLYLIWSVLRPLWIGIAPCPPRIWQT